MSYQYQILGYKKLICTAVALVKSSPNSVGFDLSSPRDAVMPPNNWITLFIDIAISLTAGTNGRVAPWSGLSALHGISVDAGVIDPDYTGNIGVVLVNRSKKPFAIHTGDRIAQLICEQVAYPELREIKDLKTATRGTEGFGSSVAGGFSLLRKVQKQSILNNWNKFWTDWLWLV